MFREMTRSHNEALTDEQMILSAPSVFATAPHEKVSDRYGYLPTIDVVNAMRSEGWFPVDATQKNVRDLSRKTLTKHLVRFRRLGDDIRVGDSVVELLLTNSHDRSSAFVLHAGIFRMACANGIVIADNTFQKLSVRHGKNVVGDIIEGSYSVINEVPQITKQVEEMQSIQLVRTEQELFANFAFGYSQGGFDPKMISTEKEISNQVLRPKRVEDRSNDLWTTYNVIQEKIIKGGIRTVKINKKGLFKNNTTRKVTSINKDIKLNQVLWEMAQEMKKLKAAA